MIQKRKARKNLWVGFLVLLCSAWVLLIPTDRAEAKSYTIDSAVFDVQLNADGSALVCEDWTMTFEGGTYTRYYKDIHQKVSQVEEFSGLTVEEVLVDGVACEETTDTEGRPEYHYSLSESAEDLTLAAYFAFGEGTHHIIFRYRLKDVVKDWGDEAAVFCYRYLGDAFDQKVRELEIRVQAPEDCAQANWDVRFADDLTVMNSDEREIVLAGSNRSGMVKVKLWLDLDAFDPLVYVDPAKADKNPVGFWGLVRRALYGVGAVLVALVVFLFVRSEKKHKQMVTEYEQDTGKFNQLIHYLPGQIPISEMLTLYIAPEDNRVFYCLLLDLMRRRILVPEMRGTADASPECPEVDFRVAYHYGLETYEKEFLEVLSRTKDPQVISDLQLNEFLMQEADKQAEAMKSITTGIHRAAVAHKQSLAVIRGVKESEIVEEIEYLHTVIQARDPENMYPNIYDIIYMTFQDLADRLDPAIITEMILRFGWSIGTGKADTVHLQNAGQPGQVILPANLEQYADARGMSSYLEGNSTYISDYVPYDMSSDVAGSYRCPSLPNLDRISEYFSGVVDRLDNQLRSASSEGSGSSCSSCSSCSGCGGGGAD